MSSPPLSPAMASGKAASDRVLRALVGLAEALGTPGMVASALAEAEAALVEAEVAQAGLEAELVAATAAAAEATPTMGVDAEALYRVLGAVADASASELERQLSRNRRHRWGLRVVQIIALVLMVLCTFLLSLDAVRETLGLTQESHIVPCLATVTLLCQVAMWGMETSKRHLATNAGHQRQQAHRYRRLARDTATTTGATAEAAEAIAATNVTLGRLEEVAGHLRNLVDAVTEDLEVAQGFPASAQVLGDTVVALGTVMGDKEGTERMAQALEALSGDK